MGATKRDLSGVFATEVHSRRVTRTTDLGWISYFGPKGITFVTSKYFPVWTELGVEMYLPPTKARHDQTVDCRGVVVQCTQRQTGNGFEVALWFVDLPRGAAARLAEPKPI